MLSSNTSLDFVPSDPTELRLAITQMAAYINIADWQFLKLIAEMDRSESWRHGGYCNLSNWLDHQCGMGPCASRERIRIGRALARLPRIDAAFRDGIISYSKVRAVTRVACEETDEMLLDLAERSSASELDSLVKTYERVGAPKRQSSHERRSLQWYYEDGMLIINASVPAEQGALLIKALEKVIDLKKEDREQYWQSRIEGGAEQDPSLKTPEDVPAETICSHPDNSYDVPAEAIGADMNDSEDVPAEAHLDSLISEGLQFQMNSHEQKRADALLDLAEHYLATVVSSTVQRRSSNRYEVVLHIDRNQLAARSKDSESARFYVDPDWGIDEEAARQITCDADITEIIQDERGDILNYERRRRIVPAKLMRALRVRDENRCRFPGCSHTKYLEAHHVQHWIDGGETRLENLAMLCSLCRARHKEHYADSNIMPRHFVTH